MSPAPTRKRRVRVAPNLYRRPSDGKFEAGLTINGRWTMKTLSARTTAAAKLELAQFRIDAFAAEPEAAKPVTIGSVAGDWLESFELQVAAGERKPRTLDHYRSNWRCHIENSFASRLITEISPDDIVRLLNELRAGGKSPHVLRAVTDVLSRIFKFAVRRGLIESCPVAKLERGERPRAPRKQQRILTHEEITALLAAAEGDSFDLIAIHLYTGMRQGEILGLPWSNVDFSSGLITVKQQLQRPRSGRGAEIAPTKTGAGTRTVVLLPQLGSILAARRLRSPFSDDEDFLFATGPTTPTHYSRANRLLAHAVQVAGIRHVSSHDFRHTYASHLIIDLRLDVVQVQRQLGHAKASITSDTYAHLFDEARHADVIRTQMAESSFAALLH